MKVNVLNIKRTKRADKCGLCKGHRSVIRKYRLFICRHCFRSQYYSLGWIKQK